jgi:hypothetical protein
MKHRRLGVLGAFDPQGMRNVIAYILSLKAREQ